MEWTNRADDHKENPVSEDLEAEIVRYIGYPQEVDEDICTTMIRKAARHFADWQKQQMMKNAVEYKVMDLHKNEDGESVPSIIVDLHKSFDFGDKVKVIIVKEDL